MMSLPCPNQLTPFRLVSSPININVAGNISSQTEGNFLHRDSLIMQNIYEVQGPDTRGNSPAGRGLTNTGKS